MLTNMLNEIEITEEIFAEACIKASNNPTHKMLLSEIMAVDNFLAFKKLMVKRNKDLTEEAYQMLNAREAGISPDMVYDQSPTQIVEENEMARAIQESLKMQVDSKASSYSSPPADEDEMLRRVLEESKREYDEAERLKKVNEEQKSVPTKPVKKRDQVSTKATKPAPERPVKTELPTTKVAKAPKELAPIGGSKLMAGATAGVTAGATAGVTAGAPAESTGLFTPGVTAGATMGATAGAAIGVASTSDIQKNAEESAKQYKINEEKKQKELQKKTNSKEDMKERMEKLRKQRDILLKQKQDQLKEEWDEYDHKKDGSSDSTKDRIQKGLEALNIKESEVKYQTETQKQKEIERKKDEKKKKKEEEEHKHDPS
jgi:hypothetical protein